MIEKTKQLLKVGDKLKLGIKKFGNNGDPMMVYEGLIIFLKDKNKGFELNKMFEIKITKILKKFALAERTYND